MNPYRFYYERLQSFYKTLLCTMFLRHDVITMYQSKIPYSMTDYMKPDTKLIIPQKTPFSRINLSSLLTGVMLFILSLCSVAFASPGKPNNNTYGNLGGPDLTNPATQLIILTYIAICNGFATNSVVGHIVDG